MQDLSSLKHFCQMPKQIPNNERIFIAWQVIKHAQFYPSFAPWLVYGWRVGGFGVLRGLSLCDLSGKSDLMVSRVCRAQVYYKHDL
ncbi:hypothetical protein [Moraxella caviae]|uniref:hypothetical protein n=1 Tax=Moraxella caviae TaxID=34060 RepID=UPI0010549607|nr:hypothetical protein [Moraxella caviae]